MIPSSFALIRWDQDYYSSRLDFRKRADSLVKIYANGKFESIPLSDEAKSEDLTVDYLYLPASEKAEKLWLITAGVHGIESYVGSALLNWLIYERVEEMVGENTGIIFIHSLNPYGFAHNRRVNENNVDLNRNFINDFKNFTDPNPAYSKFDKFLNPKKKISYTKVSKYQFWLLGAYYLIRYGMQDLRKSIVGGQYSFSNGIFYGGNQQEKSVELYEKITTPLVEKYQTIFHLDFHTGYGEWGKLHFYGVNNYPENIKKPMDEIFKGLAIDRGGDEDFYQVHGDITSYLPSLYPDKKIIPMTLEYGTMDSQKISGSLESLFRIKSENQMFHQGTRLPQQKLMIDDHFMEMFNPSSTFWKETVEKTTKEAFDLFIERFSNL